MNADGSRPYCKRPVACVAGTRGRCRVCQSKQSRRIDAIVARYKTGQHTISAVAAWFGLSRQYVGHILCKAGARDRGQMPRSRKDLTPKQLRRFRNLCNSIPAALAHEMVRR